MRRARRVTNTTATAALAGVAVVALCACGSAQAGGGGSERTTAPPASQPGPAGPPPGAEAPSGPTSASTSGPVEPLEDGEYRAAVYVPSGPTDSVPGAGSAEPLAAGSLVDLGGGCLGLETDTGERSVVAFPVGTTLEDGRVTAVGMDPFGVGQSLRYTGAAGTTASPRLALALPERCPADVGDVWYFVVPKSAGIDGPSAD